MLVLVFVTGILLVYTHQILILVLFYFFILGSVVYYVSLWFQELHKTSLDVSLRPCLPPTLYEITFTLWLVLRQTHRESLVRLFMLICQDISIWSCVGLFLLFLLILSRDEAWSEGALLLIPLELVLFSGFILSSVLNPVQTLENSSFGHVFVVTTLDAF